MLAFTDSVWVLDLACKKHTEGKQLPMLTIMNIFMYVEYLESLKQKVRCIRGPKPVLNSGECYDTYVNGSRIVMRGSHKKKWQYRRKENRQRVTQIRMKRALRLN